MVASHFIALLMFSILLDCQIQRLSNIGWSKGICWADKGWTNWPRRQRNCQGHPRWYKRSGTGMQLDWYPFGMFLLAVWRIISYLDFFYSFTVPTKISVRGAFGKPPDDSAVKRSHCFKASEKSWVLRHLMKEETSWCIHFYMLM